jgi:hypothetical protein
MPTLTNGLLFLTASVQAMTLSPTGAFIDPTSTVQAPLSTITLSLLAARKQSLANQISELQAYGGKDSKTQIEGAKADQIKRLEKQAQECKDCESAETALQSAYNASLKAHTFVEDVTTSVLNQTAAESAYNTAFRNVGDALIVWKDATSAFNLAKAALAKKVSAYGCSQASDIELYNPLITSTPLPMPAISMELAAVNAAADVVREKKGIVDAKKLIQDAKKIAWDDAIKASIATKLCNGACKQTDVDAAHKDSGAKDLLVTQAQGLRDTECAAIKVSLQEEDALQV